MNIAELKVVLKSEYGEDFNYDTWENDDKPYFETNLTNRNTLNYSQFIFFNQTLQTFWFKGIVRDDVQHLEGFSKPTKDIPTLVKDIRDMRLEAEGLLK